MAAKSNNVSADHTYPWIGEPKVGTWYEGIAVTLEQFEQAIYTMAAASGEEDWNGVEELLTEARIELTAGRVTMPTLPALLYSKALTGSYVAGREMLDDAFNRSGMTVRLFEHGHYGQPMPYVLRDLVLTAHHVICEVFLLRAHEKGEALSTELEVSVAQALGAERVIKQMYVTFPLEVIGGNRFRFDFVPFMGAMERLGLGPIRYAKTESMSGKAAADYFEGILQGGTSDNIVPTIYFGSPPSSGVAVNMTAYGCLFAQYDSWDKERTAHYSREGTVFTGPLAREYRDASKFERPRMVFALSRPDRREFEPRWPEMATPELKQPIQDLVADIVREVRR